MPENEFFKKTVLIETYWNVKEYDLQFLKNSFSGINRNILECKTDVQLFLKRLRKERINRNILECKTLSSYYLRLDSTRINRNILECKNQCI